MRVGAPVQKPKLSEHLSKVAPELKRAKVSTYVIAEAQVKFNEIFGVEMKELSRKQQKKTGAARTNMQVSEPTKEYVLKSLLSSKVRRQFIDRPEDHTGWRGEEPRREVLDSHRPCSSIGVTPKEAAGS